MAAICPSLIGARNQTLRKRPAALQLRGCGPILLRPMAAEGQLLWYTRFTTRNLKDRRPWNAGRKPGAKRPLKPQQLGRSGSGLIANSGYRTARAKIGIGDIVSGGRVPHARSWFSRKASRPVRFEHLERARGSILTWLERSGGTLDYFVFPSRADHADHISTRVCQAPR
jgi:hypothetical protein